MASWTEQMGYPCVRVERAEFTDRGQCVLTVSQAWFLIEGALSKEEEEKVWSVPLLYGTSHTVDAPQLQLLTGKADRLVVEMGHTQDWIKVRALAFRFAHTYIHAYRPAGRPTQHTHAPNPPHPNKPPTAEPRPARALPRPLPARAAGPAGLGRAGQEPPALGPRGAPPRRL